MHIGIRGGVGSVPQTGYGSAGWETFPTRGHPNATQVLTLEVAGLGLMALDQNRQDLAEVSRGLAAATVYPPSGVDKPEGTASSNHQCRKRVF